MGKGAGGAGRAAAGIQRNLAAATRAQDLFRSAVGRQARVAEQVIGGRKLSKGMQRRKERQLGTMARQTRRQWAGQARARAIAFRNARSL